MNETFLPSLPLQRLVDGQLAPRELAAWLRRLDEDPRRWREVALAFLEDQAFGQAIAASAESALRTPRPEAGSPADAKKTPRARPTARRTLRLGRSLTTAAVVLLALSLGFAGGAATGRGRTAPPPGTGWASPPQADERPVSEPWTFALRDENDQLIAQTSLFADPGPLWNYIHENSELAATTPLLSLQTPGMEVEPQWNYLTGRIPDGRQVVVPVRAYRVRTVGQ